MSQLKAPVCNFESGNYTEESISGLTLTTNEIISYDQSTWTIKQSINTARHSAAAFVIGEYGYVCGGTGSSDNTLKSTEKYDPITDTWSYVADMNVIRGDHMAFVVAGYAYVCGGYDTAFYNVTSPKYITVEKYDPTSNTWIYVESMLYGCTALNSGSVGMNGYGYVLTNNILQQYDAVNNTWSSIWATNTIITATSTVKLIVINNIMYAVSDDNMAIYKLNIITSTVSFMTWVSFSNGGDVVVVDGRAYISIGFANARKEVSRWDPITNIVTSITSAPTRTWLSTFFVINGIIYSVGGYHNMTQTLKLVVTPVSAFPVIRYTLNGTTVTTTSPIYSNSLSISIPGKINAKCYASGYTESTELSKTFNRKLPTPTFNYSSGDYLKNTVSDVEIYTDVHAMTWSPVSSPHTRHAQADMFDIDGYGYICCGEYIVYDEPTRGNTVEKYNPVTDTWSYVASANIVRTNHSSFSIGGKGYICGGTTINGNIYSYINTVECYNPVTNMWSYVANMNVAREKSSSFVINGFGYVYGGYSVAIGHYYGVEKYNPITNTWSYVASPNDTYVYRETFSIGGKGYICGGGYGYGALSSVECYDPVANTWSAKSNMITPRSNPISFVIAGKGYVCGGHYGGGIVEVYDPHTDIWTYVGNMTVHGCSLVIGETAYLYDWSSSMIKYSYNKISNIKYTTSNVNPDIYSDIYSSPLNPGLPSIVKAISYSSETGYVASDVATLTLNRKFDPPTFDLYNSVYKNNKLSNFVINSTEDISNLKIVSTTGYTVESSETNKKIISVKMPADVEVSNHTVAAGYATSEVKKIKLTEIDKPTTNYTSGIKGVDSISDLSLSIPVSVYSGSNVYRDLLYKISNDSETKYTEVLSLNLPSTIYAVNKLLYSIGDTNVFGISEPLQLILGDKKIHLEPAECNTTTIENKTRLVKGVILTDKNNEPVDLAYYKIYYTLDGSEPAENEMVSETAIEYTSPIDLYLPTRLKYCIVPIYKGDE